MPSFTTTMVRIVERCPLTLLAIACDADDQVNLEPEEEVEFEVEITYEPGWFQPGKFSGPPEDCYPDAGEDPEILSVMVVGDEQTVDITDDLSPEEYGDLVARIWDNQKQRDEDAQWDEADYKVDMLMERAWFTGNDY